MKSTTETPSAQREISLFVCRETTTNERTSVPLGLYLGFNFTLLLKNMTVLRITPGGIIFLANRYLPCGI